MYVHYEYTSPTEGEPRGPHFLDCLPSLNNAAVPPPFHVYMLISCLIRYHLLISRKIRKIPFRDVTTHFGVVSSC